MNIYMKVSVFNANRNHPIEELLQENDSGMFAEDFYAKRAVDYADALIRKLKENK